jgi:hypothetical protein
MYWCEEHGAVERPQFVYDSTGMYEVCPECKQELSAADKCGCGNWTDPTERFCEDCKKFISNIGLKLTDEYEKQTGKEVDEEHIKELMELWINQ